MTAAGLLLAILGAALIYSGMTGADLREVIPAALSGKPVPKGSSSEAEGRGGRMSPPDPDIGGGGGSGGSGGGGFVSSPNPNDRLRV